MSFPFNPSVKVHWTGGARVVRGKSVTEHLRGWPVCCSGDRAVKLAETGQTTNAIVDHVTCKLCIAVCRRAGLFDPCERAHVSSGCGRVFELTSLASAMANRDEHQLKCRTCMSASAAPNYVCLKCPGVHPVGYKCDNALG